MGKTSLHKNMEVKEITAMQHLVESYELQKTSRFLSQVAFVCCGNEPVDHVNDCTVVSLEGSLSMKLPCMRLQSIKDFMPQG